MGFLDDLQAIMSVVMKDGAEIDGGIYFNYDSDHLQKMQKIIGADTRYYYTVQKKCGLEPFEDSYINRNSEIILVNQDHFAINADFKDKEVELKDKVYNAIDEVYNKVINNTIEQDNDLLDLDAQWEAMGGDMF